jgi:hypothetical protein
LWNAIRRKLSVNKKGVITVIHFLSLSFFQIKERRMILARNLSFLGEMRNAYEALLGKPAGKCPFTRRKRRWNDNVKLFLKK